MNITLTLLFSIRAYDFNFKGETFLPVGILVQLVSGGLCSVWKVMWLLCSAPVLQDSLVFVVGKMDGLMVVSGRRHNADDVVATVLAVEPMKFVYRGR